MPATKNPAQETDGVALTSATGQEIYDLLMAGIEPELITSALPYLEEKYKDETPEQAQERAARYEKAFAEYAKQLGDYMAGMKSGLRKVHLGVMSGFESFDRADDEKLLQSLEQSILAA